MRPLALLTLCAASFAAAQSAQRPHITGVAHIAIFSKDVEASRAFYTGLLGFQEAFKTFQPDGKLSLTFIKINDRQFIELFPEREPLSDRMAHFAVEVDDAEAMRAYLASKGITVPERVPKGRTGNLNFTIKDPDGRGIEFVQYMPGGQVDLTRGKSMGDRASARMTHVGILVGDLDKANAFYRDILGFTETWRGSRDGKTLNWVNMKVPDGDDYIEFMLYDKLPEPTARGSAHHLCLSVDDIEKSKAWLEARESRKLYTRPLEVRTGINRRRQLNLFDPDGTRSELMEPRTVDGRPVASATAPPPSRQ